MIYEIWDRNSGNRLGEFSTPQDALRMVSKMAARASKKEIEGLVFDREFDGRTIKIMEGRALVESALKQASTAGASSPVRRVRRLVAAKKARKKRSK